MNHLRLDVRITFKTSFHTTGNRWLWGADKASAISVDDSYVIPATTLKGLLRSNAESILRSWGIRTCVGTRPETLCHNAQALCLVCQVFGNSRQIAALKFTDVVPLDRVSSQIRSGVVINRQRRVAFPQRLFSIETVEAMPVEWAAVWEGYFNQEERARKAAALILLAANLSSAIGGGRSRGLGWVEKWNIQGMLDGQPLPEAESRGYWETWAGGQDS